MYKHNLKTLLRLSDFRKGNQLVNFREQVLNLIPKSVCAVEITIYVDWTCINVN